MHVMSQVAKLFVLARQVGSTLACSVRVVHSTVHSSLPRRSYSSRPSSSNSFCRTSNCSSSSCPVPSGARAGAAVIQGLTGVVTPRRLTQCRTLTPCRCSPCLYLICLDLLLAMSLPRSRPPWPRQCNPLLSGTNVGPMRPTLHQRRQLPVVGFSSRRRRLVRTQVDIPMEEMIPVAAQGYRTACGRCCPTSTLVLRLAA
mmetsp:Transcript_9792/g.22476  ORF Transcript_9792/g.22476 Transcript_9792/m.22476 type:complete len:200 (+) Transcript_9792:531-1130(+)